MKTTEVIKIKYADTFVILFMEEDVQPTITTILEEGFLLGEEIGISKIEMTEKEINELPEFDGF